MKFSTLRRHIREGSKNIYRNGWMSVASIGAVTVALVLVAIFVTVILNINQMAANVEKDVEIKTLIELTAEEEEIEALGEEIKQIDGIDTMRFSSKDDELSSLVEGMGEQGEAWALFEQDNPLNHAYVIKAANPQETESIAETIEKLDHVYKVNYGQDVVPQLFKFNNYARTLGIVLIAGLVFMAVFLISNTIKLTIHARSREIGIMKLVGATNGFIRWPFFVEGLILGVLGSIIPVLITTIGYHFVLQNVSGQTSFNFVELLPYSPFVFQLSLFIIFIGAIIGMWGSGMSLRKFLKV